MVVNKSNKLSYYLTCKAIIIYVSEVSSMTLAEKNFTGYVILFHPKLDPVTFAGVSLTLENSYRLLHPISLKCKLVISNTGNERLLCNLEDYKESQVKQNLEKDHGLHHLKAYFC